MTLLISNLIMKLALHFLVEGNIILKGSSQKNKQWGEMGLCVVFSVLPWLLFLPRQPGLSREAQHVLNSPPQMLDPIPKLKI